ncbi:MAG: hypothetical protein ABIE22_04630 [archaeon]
MKIPGYIIAIIGLVVVASTFISERIPLLKNIPQAYIMIAGFAVIIIGTVMISQGKGGRAKQKQKEVPIYKGKEIVGYRRNK